VSRCGTEEAATTLQLSDGQSEGTAVGEDHVFHSTTCKNGGYYSNGLKSKHVQSYFGQRTPAASSMVIKDWYTMEMPPVATFFFV
jgi:hypothetical protein